MKNFVRRSLAVFLTFSALGVILFFSIPSILDSWVIPSLLKRMSLENQHAQITRLTPFAADGTISIAENDVPTFSVPHFEILFSPASLLKKRLIAAVLDHATLHLSRQDGRISLQGITPSGSSSAPLTRIFPLLPFMVDTLVLNECSVVLHEPQKPDIRITVSARIVPVFSSNGSSFSLDSLAATFTLSDTLTAKGTISISQDESEHLISMSIDSNFFMLPDRFRPPATSLAESGPVFADISLRLAKDTLALKSLDVQGTARGLLLRHDPIEIIGGGPEGRVSFSLIGTPARLDYKLAPLEVSAPQPLAISLSGSASMAGDVVSTTGQIQIVWQPTLLQENIQVPVNIDYSGSVLSPEQWDVQVTGQSYPADGLRLQSGELSADAPGFSLNGALQGGKTGFNADIGLTLARADLTYNKAKLSISGLNLRLHATRDDKTTDARIRLTIPHLSLPDHDVFADNLLLDLPLTLPFRTGQNKERGTFSVASLGHRQEVLASVQGSLTQQGERISLAAKVQAAFKPEPALDLTGAWLPLENEFAIDWNLPATLLQSSALPSLLNIPAGYVFGAEIETGGYLHYQNNRLSGAMHTSLRDGHLAISDKHISVDHVNCDLENPHLPDLNSAPSQSCTVKNIDIGAFSFSDGSVTYRLEDARTLFIEKSNIKWSQGSLESGSLRLTPDDMDIDTIIYCNRVNFADLLNQFGFDQTEGEGSLNGKLPITITKTGIRFYNGFLFSTPGTGGIVRFSDTNLLRQGMGDVTQAGYLNYSLMALEDFAYNWTRLSFNSSGDDLLMSMELDGKPRSPLPFALKNGVIIEKDQGNGLQYPVRLDVNFRLPLNQLLQVGKDFKSIMGNH